MDYSRYHNLSKILGLKKNADPRYFGKKNDENLVHDSSFFIPNEVLALSGDACKLYAVIQRKAGKSGWCYARVNTLLADSQLSEYRYVKAKKDLEDARLIWADCWKDGYGCLNFICPKYSRQIAVACLIDLDDHEFAKELIDYFGDSDIAKVALKGKIRKVAQAKRRAYVTPKKGQTSGESKGVHFGSHDARKTESSFHIESLSTFGEGTASRAPAREEAAAFFLEDEGKEKRDVALEERLLKEVLTEEFCKKKEIVNPVGWARHAVKAGYAQRYLEGNDRHTKGVTRMEGNRKIAKIVDHYIEQKGNQKPWSYFWTSTSGDAFVIGTRGACDPGKPILYDIDSQKFIEDINKYFQDRNIDICPLFDSLKLQFPGSDPGRRMEDSTTPKSTTSESTRSSSSPRPQDLVLTAAPSKSSLSSACPSRSPGPPSERPHRSDVSIAQSQTSATSSSLSRMLSTSFAGKMTNKSLASLPERYTENSQERSYG